MSQRPTHAQQLAAGQRFDFGRNWAAFLRRVDGRHLEAAAHQLQAYLGPVELRGQRFLDVGSGSGLSSLAAWQLGAEVTSFDFDPQCVACTEALKRKWQAGDQRWHIVEGSVLDPAFLAGLGQFDVVHAWGMLHQTGDQWQALENCIRLVSPGGRLIVAIYNDQGGWSGRWRMLKRLYNRLPRALRLPYALLVMGLRELRLAAVAAVTWRWGEYRRSWTQYHQQRGMSRWHDLIDWIGGYPHEVARPEEVFNYCRARGLQLEFLKTAGASIACNEYVFRRPAAGAAC